MLGGRWAGKGGGEDSFVLQSSAEFCVGGAHLFPLMVPLTIFHRCVHVIMMTVSYAFFMLGEAYYKFYDFL